MNLIKFSSKEIFSFLLVFATIISTIYILIFNMAYHPDFPTQKPYSIIRRQNLPNLRNKSSLKKLQSAFTATKKITFHSAVYHQKNFSRRIIKVPIVYLRDPIAHDAYKSYLAKRETPLPLQTKVVIILTNHRSGSSFVGELFNQHPDVFYMFEPLYGTAVGYGTDCEPQAEQLEILKSWSQCIVPDWKKIYSRLDPKYQKLVNRFRLQNCINQQFCFRTFTKELCEPNHCIRSKINHRYPHNCERDCGSLNINLVENECRQKSMVALKLIRFCDINMLKQLIDIGLDLKVIHLIRDPRGIANSRLNLKVPDILTSINFTCWKQAHNAKTGLFKCPDWLKNRYKLIRFEDAAMYPYKVANMIYDFVELEMSSNVFKWISLNTVIKSQGAKNETELINQKTNHKYIKLKAKQKQSPYDHARNSSEVVERWKKELPFSMVTKIDRVCHDIMKITGYIAVNDTISYNDKNISYYKPISSY